MSVKCEVCGDEHECNPPCFLCDNYATWEGWRNNGAGVWQLVEVCDAHKHELRGFQNGVSPSDTSAGENAP